jgi:hypothetical protein
MATSIAMKKFPVKKTIGDTSLKALVAVSGIPYRTLFRWREEDRIPGGDAAMRFNHLKAAVEKVRAAQQVAA